MRVGSIYLTRRTAVTLGSPVKASRAIVSAIDGRFAMRVRVEDLIGAASSHAVVAGLTHDFYRYPARFSPVLARTLIEAFSEPGDVVFDPFMGGGTTLVEALALGRTAAGTDVSALARFVTSAKTTMFGTRDLLAVRAWAENAHAALRLKTGLQSAQMHDDPRLRNLCSTRTWRVQRLIAKALATVDGAGSRPVQAFARMAILRTAQWALDCRRNVPRAEEFRDAFSKTVERMIEGSRTFTAAVRAAYPRGSGKVVALERSAVGCDSDARLRRLGRPALVLTSPPYPGVHALYHRWQILGRKETPAPFWIANVNDGHGASHYTLGGRKNHDARYFAQIGAAFSSVAKLCSYETVVAQVVAFTSPREHLHDYLSAIAAAGFREMKFRVQQTEDGRIWRSVPNRKWYADRRGATPASKEVVLFHTLRR